MYDRIRKTFREILLADYAFKVAQDKCRKWTKFKQAKRYVDFYMGLWCVLLLASVATLSFNRLAPGIVIAGPTLFWLAWVALTFAMMGMRVSVVLPEGKAYKLNVFEKLSVKLQVFALRTFLHWDNQRLFKWASNQNTVCMRQVAFRNYEIRTVFHC